MEIGEDKRQWLDVIGSVLIRAFAVGMAFLIVWFVGYLTLMGFAFRIHSGMVNITEDQFMLMNYIGMGLLKLVLFTVFLMPYLAIRWTLRGTGK